MNAMCDLSGSRLEMVRLDQEIEARLMNVESDRFIGFLIPPIAGCVQGSMKTGLTCLKRGK